MSTSKTFCAIEIYSRHTYRAKRLIAAIYSNFDHVRPFIVVDGAMWTLFKGEKKTIGMQNVWQVKPSPAALNEPGNTNTRKR